MKKPDPPILAEARRLVAAGISVLPVGIDGLKQPAFDLLPLRPDPTNPAGKSRTWTPFQEHLPADPQLCRWFGNGRVLGIAAIGGQVSGHLEQIDFDSAELIEPYRQIVEEEAPGLVDRLVWIETPRPGGRALYRCAEPVEKNLTLARRLMPADEKHPNPWPKATIETRGEGGYAVLPGSALQVHETGRPYRLLKGDLANLPVITAAERRTLLDCARRLTEYLEPERLHRPAAAERRGADAGLLPGADFNARGDVGALLLAAGWTLSYRRGDTEYWRRPGKAKGHSATLHHVAPNVLVSFSPNAAPLAGDSEGQGYDAFAVYTLLMHNGDYPTAGKQLYADGYGDRGAPESPALPSDADAPPERSPHAVSSDSRAAAEKLPTLRPPRRSSFTDTELEELDLPEPDPIVEELLLPGAGLLCGKPKTGKTWLSLSLGVAVAGDGRALGTLKVRAGEVLYLALEDNERRLKKRLRMLRAGAKPSGRLHFELHWRRQDQGGLDDLRQWLIKHPDCRLVVIDTWAKFKPRRKGNSDLFSEDYDPTQALNALGEEHDVCILIVHHRRKGRSDDDVFDTVSATTGMTAGVGATLILEKGRGEANGFLSTTGRDIEDQELALIIEPQSRAWVIAGDAEDFQPISPERQAIQAICAESAEGLGPTEIAKRLGQTTKEEQNAVRNLVSKMQKAGQLTQKSRGRYVFVAKSTKPGYIGDAVTRLHGYIPPDPRLLPEREEPAQCHRCNEVTDVTDVTDATRNGTFSPQPDSVSLPSSSSSSSRERESKKECSLAILGGEPSPEELEEEIVV